MRADLASRPELAQLIRVSTFLVDGRAADDDTPLPGDGTVDVLPPFAGG